MKNKRERKKKKKNKLKEKMFPLSNICNVLPLMCKLHNPNKFKCLISSPSIRFGRYPTTCVAFAAGAGAVFLTALSNSYAMFVISRVVLGATFFSSNVLTCTLSK